MIVIVVVRCTNHHCSVASSPLARSSGLASRAMVVLRSFQDLDHEQLTVEQRYVRARSEPLLMPPGPYGLIYCSLFHNIRPPHELYADVCLIMSLTHSIDEVKAEIQRVWNIAPERQRLCFFYRGPQKRSRKKFIRCYPNTFLVEHLIRSQFAGPHTPVIGAGWSLECEVGIGSPRHRISKKRPDCYCHYWMAKRPRVE